MYEEHRNHLRGDEVAGRGFGYECLWRCRLMLRLGPSDSLSIYQGEDALTYLTTRENRQKIYYQVKHTTGQWTPKRLDEFLKRATETLAKKDDASYVFCTNVSQTPTLKASFEEINEKYGKRSTKGKHVDRLKYQLWVLDPDDPPDKIRDAIRSVLKSRFEPRKIGTVLPDGEVESCCEKLLALEARFKLTAGASVTGTEVWERAGLEELASRIPSLVLGDRLFTWPAWVHYAKSRNSDATLAATRRVAIDLNGIALDVEDQVLALAEQWAESPTDCALCLITGASGVGKTWLLLRLGVRLSSRVSVYWGDELSAGADPELTALSAWEDKATVVLIDNLIEAEWARMIPGALRSRPPILVIGTTAKHDHTEEALLLKEKAGQKCISFALGPLLSAGEISRLVDALRSGIVATAERKQLESANVRHAVRLLTGQESERDVTDRLVSLWRSNDCQPWVMPLLLCSSLGVKIPKSLLRDHARRNAHARRELPDELWPLVLRAKRDSEEEEQVWVEDVNLAQKALAAVEDEIGKSQLEQMLAKEAASFSHCVQLGSSIHRRFARRITREFSDGYPAYRAGHFASWKDTIMALLPFETRAALAYSWLPYLPQMERKAEAKKAAEEFVAGGPHSVADVILMVEGFGDEHARKAVEAELQIASRWHIDPWASFIEHLRPLDAQAQRELLTLAVPLLQSAPLDFDKLLDTRNVAVDLITVVKDRGRAEHREWLRTMLDAALPVPSSAESLRRGYLTNLYLPLVQRCIIQARSGIVLIIIRDLLTALHGKESLGELYGKTYDLYKAAYQEEQLKSYHIGALRRGFHYLAGEPSPTKAGDIWPTLLDFASKWADPEWLYGIEEKAYQFLRSVMGAGLLPKLCEVLFLACGRDLISRGNASQSRLKTLLGFFVNPPATHVCEQLAIILAGAVIKQEPPAARELVTKARSLLKARCVGSGGEVIELTNEFLNALADEVGGDHPKPLAIAQTAALAAPVVIDLLYCIGNVSWSRDEQREIASAIYNLWSHTHRWNVIFTLLQLEAKEESKAAIEALLGENRAHPDALLLAASWEARFGSPELSEDRIVDALQTYLKTTEGAHPPQVRRAYLDLARRSSSPKREVLELCAALQYEGPLAPLFTPAAEA